MAQSFYSVVLDHSADAVWQVIRSFGAYDWAGVVSQTVIEDGKQGDQVGAVRRVCVGDRVIRQRLLAHSDVDRSYTYEFLDGAPVRNYCATITVTPVTETGRAFVEWRASFDCAEDKLQYWAQFFAQEGFAVWLGSLRQVMAPH